MELEEPFLNSSAHHRECLESSDFLDDIQWISLISKNLLFLPLIMYIFKYFLKASIFKLKFQINMKIFTFPTQRVQYVKLAGGEFLSEL